MQRFDKAATKMIINHSGGTGWGYPSADCTLRKISTKEFPMFYRRGFGGLLAVLLGFLSHNAARADQIFVTNRNGTIGEYTTAGATVDPALISGLGNPFGIAISGSD